MEHQPPDAEKGVSPAETFSAQGHDVARTRSILGIPALLDGNVSRQLAYNSSQLRHDTRTTGKPEDTRVAQIDRPRECNLPALGHGASSPRETQSARTGGDATGQESHGASYMPRPADHSSLYASNNTPAIPTHGQIRPLPLNPTLPTQLDLVGGNSDPPDPGAAAVQPSERNANRDGQDDDDDDEGINDEASASGFIPVYRGQGLPQQDARRQSSLSSPFTHPNGVSMFPHLSTPEQEELAQEAITQAQDFIVADNDQGFATESDGGYESDGLSSASTSAESSVRDYMFENGRRYHRFREGHYNFPNEEVEQEREDMKHAMVKLLCSQTLHFAPIGNHPQEILDIGTGTGIWAIEMGDSFPSANILGIDLSPIQPDWLPPNVRFMVDDAESPWLFPRNHFDYIHSRHTVMAIKDWDRLYGRAFEHLKSGGWMEMQEIHHRPRSATMEGLVPVDHPVARFWTLVTEGLAALGVDLDISSGGILAGKMQQAGFMNVTERVFHVPIGTWPKNKLLKTVGLYWRTILLDGLQAIAMGPLTRGLRWHREQVEMLLMEVRQAYHDNNALMYMPLHVTYAQKPAGGYH
ncbi:hypothetical protein E4U17_004064 [Claviceps sp. LM77 group G4]|nr:hypothetical protein E4U17_004064 [Claviceps sp. LM77 group G4]KAG6070616.1 hypothetical protein E4U33_004111 [Claviceps sp. LM78 group G4]KAG6075492.1 hypothetical protein E4U16_003338 [Claviceps sp. LM84 group G4]